MGVYDGKNMKNFTISMNDLFLRRAQLKNLVRIFVWSLVDN